MTSEFLVGLQWSVLRHPALVVIASLLLSNYHFLLLCLLPVLQQFQLLFAFWSCQLPILPKSQEAPSWCFYLPRPTGNESLFT